jgi:tetratricopeptide (TPR) repeat protein
MMLTQELDGPQLARNVVFRDLIDRIAKISALAQGKRATAIRQGSLDRAVPITFRGLASGLMRIAERYASIRNSGGTFSAGVRAVKAAEAASGPVHAIRYLIRTADLCEQSGHALLALTVLDDAENKRKSLGAGVEEALQRRLDATIQRRYHLLLGRLFEAMMKERQAEELWRLAQSRAAHALEHGERSIMAQCFAWMAAAAVLEEKYDLAKDHAQDAIALARSCRQRFYEGFASFYLGHAERASGHPEDAARAYSRALSLLGGRRFGPIHAATMLSMAEVTEQLGNREAALKLYASARELARAMHQRDIEEAASLGERRARQST